MASSFGVSTSSPPGSRPDPPSDTPPRPDDFWEVIAHNLHLLDIPENNQSRLDIQRHVRAWLQRPPLLPEEFHLTPYSFFLWTPEEQQHYREWCWEQGGRHLTWTDYIHYFSVHASNPADVLLLLWDWHDLPWHPTPCGRPSDGFLDGKLSLSPRISPASVRAVRAERWDILLTQVPPAQWLEPLYPVNGQSPGTTLWERFYNSAFFQYEPDPGWRCHVWQRLVRLYCQITPLVSHPWKPYLTDLPLHLPVNDPAPEVSHCVAELQAALSNAFSALFIDPGKPEPETT